METSKDAFKFREARIVGGDKGAGIGDVDGLGGLDGMKKGMVNLFGYEGWGIISGEDGFG